MKAKKKKCKGTGNAKGYGCGKETYHRVYGLGKMCGCYSDWLLNSPLGRIKLEKAKIKATKPRLELEKAIKDDKDRKRLPVVLAQTQIVFNKYIRLRDKNKPCISSGFPLGNYFDAGHLFSVKQYSGLRFNENNVHGQSIQQNRHEYGNFEDYLILVEGRIGKDALNELKQLAKEDKRNPKQWDINEVLEIKNKYQLKLKEL